jgi:aminoglycoside phosphotransferase (APT) family kinase protein
MKLRFPRPELCCTPTLARTTKLVDMGFHWRWDRRVPGPMHTDEFAIDRMLVRALLAQACPAWSDLPVEPLSASGSSNALFRLGTELLVRLPRQPGGSATILKEARWLSQLAAALPAAVPEIVIVGEPAFGYPEHWSVVRWLDGDVPTLTARTELAEPPRHGLAFDLAELVKALRGMPVPAGALNDPALRSYRGEALVTGDDRTRQAIEACRSIEGLALDLDAALCVWEDALALPGAARPSAPRWLHGDLLAENLLVRDDRLAAVLDFGGLAVGDPTVDLIVAWELLDPSARRTFRESLAVDDSTWLTGRAWALSLCLGTFPYYWRTMPERCASRLAVVQTILADANHSQL